jgi:hypothetical protein
MQFEAVDPPHRRLAAPGINPENAVLSDACSMTDCDRGRINEAATCAGSALQVQVDGQRHEKARHEVDTAGVAEQLRKLLAQVEVDVLAGDPFEGPIARLLNEDEHGQDLGGVQPRRSASLPFPRGQQFTLPQRLEALPKPIHRAKQVEYTHSDAASSGLMGRGKPLHIPAGGITLIQDSRGISMNEGEPRTAPCYDAKGITASS